MFNGLVVDGIAYDMVCAVERTARITSSDVSGMLYNLKRYNDALATYVDYEISIAVPIGQEARYAKLYEVLTSPVQEHSFLLPYNQEIIEVIGNVEEVTDSYVKEVDRESNTVHLWRRTRFSVYSTDPIKKAIDEPEE